MTPEERFARDLQFAHDMSQLWPDPAKRSEVRAILERSALSRWFIAQEPWHVRLFWHVAAKSPSLARLIMTDQCRRSAITLGEMVKMAQRESGLGEDPS